VDMYDVKNLI